MKIVFYDTKPYDRESFERCNGNYPDIEVEYVRLSIPISARE